MIVKIEIDAIQEKKRAVVLHIHTSAAEIN